MAEEEEKKQEPKTKYERAIAQIEKAKDIHTHLGYLEGYSDGIVIDKIERDSSRSRGKSIFLRLDYKIGEVSQDAAIYLRKAVWQMHNKIIARAKQLLATDTERIVREANEEARQILDSVYVKGGDVAALVTELIDPEKIDERIATLSEDVKQAYDEIERLKKKKAKRK